MANQKRKASTPSPPEADKPRDVVEEAWYDADEKTWRWRVTETIKAKPDVKVGTAASEGEAKEMAKEAAKDAASASG